MAAEGAKNIGIGGTIFVVGSFVTAATYSAAQGGGQSGRAAARNKQVDHVRLARAAFSTLIRVLSSTAFRTEKVRAVIQAV